MNKREVWDAYDADGNLLGFDLYRDEAELIEPGTYHAVADIITVTKDKTVLITQRDPRKPFGLKWEFSGGSVLKGETPLAGAVRELFEETGVTVQKEWMTFLGGSQSAYGFGRDYGVRMNFPLRAVKLQPGETCDAKWVEREEFWRMAESGEVASSVIEHMQDYMDNFKKFIGQEA